MVSEQTGFSKDKKVAKSGQNFGKTNYHTTLIHCTVVRAYIQPTIGYLHRKEMDLKKKKCEKLGKKNKFPAQFFLCQNNSFKRLKDGALSFFV